MLQYYEIIHHEVAFFPGKNKDELLTILQNIA